MDSNASGLPSIESEPTLSHIHLHLKKWDSSGQSEIVKLLIDREQITYEHLRQLVKETFSISSDFVLFYLMPEGYGHSSRYLPILSDWDISAAIFVANKKTLVIKVDVKRTEPYGDALKDWAILDTDDFPESDKALQSSAVGVTTDANRGLSFLKFPLYHLWQRGHIRNAQSLENVTKRPLSLSNFRCFLDNEGRLVFMEQFRLRVFQGGCDPRLRSTVWPLILDVFPKGLSEKERCSYLSTLSKEYMALRQGWIDRLWSRTAGEEMRWVLNAIRKDVIRTDRRNPFYAGDEDENSNLMSLFNILTTYALFHPQISYCQGMSDLASPLLVVMGDEALAYILFCALMNRLRGNFQYDGRLMTRKFRDLCELLDYFDPEFYDYLREMHADDLLFCYRWLLLELKREFTFDDALRLMEINWASMEPLPPAFRLSLQDPEPTVVDQALCSSCMSRLNPLAAPGNTKDPASSYKLSTYGQDDSLDTGRPIYFQSRHRFDSLSSCHSCPACLSDLYSKSNAQIAEAGLSPMESIISLGSPSSLNVTPCERKTSIGNIWLKVEEPEGEPLIVATAECTVDDHSVEEEALNSPVPVAEDASTKCCQIPTQFTMSEIQQICDIQPSSSCNCSDMYPNRSRQPSGSPPESSTVDDQSKRISRHASTTTATNCSATVANVLDSGFAESQAALRTPTEFSKTSLGGSNRMDKEEIVDEIVSTSMHHRPRAKSYDCLGGGNPFLLFICVAVVLQHRDLIMQRKMDFNDIAIYFDEQMKRHDINKVLRRARMLYAQYRQENQAALCS